MKGFTEACQLYVALIVFGIFFGQLYFAEFQVGSTMAGVAGLVIGSVGVKWVQVSLSRAGLVVGLCVVGLVGVGIDAFEYYSKHNVPGNSGCRIDEEEIQPCVQVAQFIE